MKNWIIGIVLVAVLALVLYFALRKPPKSDAQKACEIAAKAAGQDPSLCALTDAVIGAIGDAAEAVGEAVYDQTGNPFGYTERCPADVRAANGCDAWGADRLAALDALDAKYCHNAGAVPLECSGYLVERADIKGLHPGAATIYEQRTKAKFAGSAAAGLSALNRVQPKGKMA